MSAPLTIGFFTDTYLPEVNGVVTSIVATAKAMRRRGHRVIVVAPSTAPSDEAEPDVFRFRSVPFPFYPQFRMAFPLPARMLATLPKLPFDVIHAHSVFFVGCLGAYLAQHRRVPLGFTYHTRLEDYIHYLPVHHRITTAQAVWLSREFARRCDFVVAPTRDISELLRGYGVDAPVEVIPTGVDVEMFAGPRQTSPEEIRLRAGGPIALFAGRLGKEKNLDLLLDAFAHAKTHIPRAKLVIAGEGPHRSSLEAKAVQLGLGDSVEFTGSISQPQLGAYYRAAELFVFASVTETQGLVLFEAMTHGLPVVAVDHPVVRDAVGADAGLLTPESAGDLGDAMVRAFTMPADERARRSVAALHAAAPYSVDALAERLEPFYRRPLRPVAPA